MKREFKIGDRVRVYFALPGKNGVAVRDATVENREMQKTVLGHPCVWVLLDKAVPTWDECDNECEIVRLWVHVKQCRRLVKKKRQEVEVLGFDTCDGDFHLIVSPEISIYKGMKLREVKRK